VWNAAVEGRRLSFHLAGINNQNFIMRDDETGSWWQQVTGESTFGPLKGRRLEQIVHDELTFSEWKREQPRGRVLRPDDGSKWREFSLDWEEKTGKLRVVTEVDPGDAVGPRAIVFGLKVGGEAKAYPLSAVEKQSPVLDRVGEAPVVIVMGDDRKSVRAFEAAVDGQALELFAKPGSSPLRLVDTSTGSEWDFTGKAVSGKHSGRSLKKIPILKDYWFDWKLYNPGTQVYGFAAR